MPFKLNCNYHARISYKKDINPYFKLKSVDKFSAELQELIIVCEESFYPALKFLKKAHEIGVKFKSYIPDDKVWFKSK